MANTSAFTIDMGVFTAQTIKASIANTTNAYIAIARVGAWPNDAAPNVANSSVASVYGIWRNMIGGKKITGGDVSFVIQRQNWTANSVYVPYDHNRSTLYGNANLHYVMTDDFNVYKCLFNNRNANSTVKPTTTNPNTSYTTSDGYIWKYMYTLSDVDRVRFLTPDWIPVRTLASNDGSLQWRVQQSAVAGAIDVIKVVSGGNNYTSNNLTITITGDGSSATARANIVPVSNTVQFVTVTSRGSGYTYANATVSGSTGTGAVFDVVIGPRGGHGSDAVSELGAKAIMINARIRADEGGKIPIVNDFRQVALLVDPLSFSAGNNYSGTAFNQTQRLTVTGSGANFAQDEIVFQGISLATATYTGDVVEFDSANGVVKVANTGGVPTAGQLIGATTAAARYVTTVTEPDLRKNSGKIIYIDNITPVARNASQTEDIKLVLSFL